MPDAHLQDFLADRDVPCPVCGYNLRSLMQDRCPECGSVLDLGLIMTLDRSFHTRRRAVHYAASAFVAVVIAGFVVAGFARRALAIIPLSLPLVVIGLLGSIFVLGYDRMIYQTRARSARARALPSFGRVTWAWTGLLVVVTAVIVAVFGVILP